VGKLLQSLLIFYDVGTSELIYDFLILSHFYKVLTSRILGKIVK